MFIWGLGKCLRDAAQQTDYAHSASSIRDSPSFEFNAVCLLSFAQTLRRRWRLLRHYSPYKAVITWLASVHWISACLSHYPLIRLALQLGWSSSSFAHSCIRLLFCFPPSRSLLIVWKAENAISWTECLNPFSLFSSRSLHYFADILKLENSSNRYY